MEEFEALTFADAADQLGISVDEVRSLVVSGALQAHGGTRPRIAYDELVHFVRDQRERAFVLGITGQPVPDLLLMRPDRHAE